MIVTIGCLLLSGGCDRGTSLAGGAESGSMQMDLSAEEKKQLQKEVDRAESGSYGLVFYQSSYQNMNVVGRVGGEPFALVAGTHEPNFPFFGDRPWDNGLLMVGDDQYHFTHRTLGKALEIDLPMGKESGSATVRYDGTMTRVSDGASVEIDLELPLKFRRYPPLQLGKPYVFLDKPFAEKFVGMRWQPFELQSAPGTRATVAAAGGSARSITGLNGELEYGVLANLQAPRLAFSYDYVNLAEAGSDGYAFVDYTANPLDDSGMLGEVLKRLMHTFASATVTLDDRFERSNLHDVDRPPQDDPSVVLFENEVDLELAVLKRQMIETTDADGDKLYGLREIFVPK
jgi:hypothetical protein